jgi:hypothetical protein
VLDRQALTARGDRREEAGQQRQQERRDWTGTPVASDPSSILH